MDNNDTNLRLQRHEHKVETLDQLKKKALHTFKREVLGCLICFFFSLSFSSLHSSRSQLTT